jgi:signal peptidase II
MTARYRGFLLAAFIYLIDQAVKWWVTGPLGLRVEGDQLLLLPIFDLTLVHNYGVSLGLFTADSVAQGWALVALTGAISLFVARWLWKEANRHDAIALGVILGGALGNLTDRIRFGYVQDFLDLHFGAFRPFLVFNVGDAAITIGVLILLARALLTKDGGARGVVEKDNA